MKDHPRHIALLQAVVHDTPAEAQVVAESVQPIATPAAAEPPHVEIADVLGAAPDLEALALFRGGPDGTDASIVVSGMTDDGHGASCRKVEALIRCVDFAGLSRDHLVDVLGHADLPAVPTPEWVLSVLTKAEHATEHVASIDVFLDDAGPVLMIEEADVGDVRFAIRRDRRWRVSSPKSGGKTVKPSYFGSLDTTRATGAPSIGIIIGYYTKESCVRSETIELVVMQIDDAELVDRGRVVVGAGVWIQGDGAYRPFDPKDPDHYRIQLRPRIQHDGGIRFEIESRHTPQALRKHSVACGVPLDLQDVESLTKLVGHHALRDVLRTDAESSE